MGTGLCTAGGCEASLAFTPEVRTNMQCGCARRPILLPWAPLFSDQPCPGSQLGSKLSDLGQWQGSLCQHLSSQKLNSSSYFLTISLSCENVTCCGLIVAAALDEDAFLELSLNSYEIHATDRPGSTGQQDDEGLNSIRSLAV